MKMGFFGGFAILLAGVGASDVRADDAATLAAAPLVVSVTPGSGGGPWKLRVENTGDLPVRIAADPRLLVLDVTPPAGFVDPTAKTKRAATSKVQEPPRGVRCVLPDDARPSTDEGRELVVPSKRSWSTNIDPLFYCFSARERAVLVTGATVTAHFGWPAPLVKPSARTKPIVTAPPFVAAPVGAAIGKVAPAKVLAAAPFTLTEGVAPSPPATSAADTTAPGATAPGATALPPLPPGSAALVVSMPDALDVARGNEISSTVTVVNVGDKAAVFLLRAEMFRFSVAGPAGSVACGTTRAVDAPIRELYSTVAPRGRGSIGVLVNALCPSDTFDGPGVYRVTPTLDTSEASGRTIGLKTWDGEAAARSPMLVRVRSSRRPPTSTTRPALD
jgi:hypothetical protein